MFNAQHKKTIARLEAELHANQGLTRALERSMAVIEFDPTAPSCVPTTTFSA